MQESALRAGEFRASQDDGLAKISSRNFRRCCPARALRAGDRPERAVGAIALKAVEDGYIELADQSASSWRSCPRAGLREKNGRGSRQARERCSSPSGADIPRFRKIVRDSASSRDYKQKTMA